MALVSNELNPNAIYVKNHDLSSCNVVTNNTNANRSMIRAHRARLNQQNSRRINPKAFQTYGDPTPHDMFNVNNLIHDWQYGAKGMSQSADKTQYKTSTSFNRKKKISNVYNKEFTKTVNEPFKFKIGNQNQSHRLDEMDKPYLHKNIDHQQGKDKYLVGTKNMTHGDQNTYFPGMQETIRNNQLHKSDTQHDQEKAKDQAGYKTIKDYYILELEKENNIYDNKNNQLKRRQNTKHSYPKSLLKHIKTYENTNAAGDKDDVFSKFDKTENGFYGPINDDIQFNKFHTTGESFNKSNQSFFPQIIEPESSKYGSFYNTRSSCNTPDHKWNSNINGIVIKTGSNFTNNRLHGLKNLDKMAITHNFKGAFSNQNTSTNRGAVVNNSVVKGANYKRFVSNGDFSKKDNIFGDTGSSFRNGMRDTTMSIGRVPFQIQKRNFI